MAFDLGDGDEALGGAAIGHLLIHLGRDLIAGLYTFVHYPFSIIHYKRLHDLVAAGDAVADFALALDDEEAFLAA